MGPGVDHISGPCRVASHERFEVTSYLDRFVADAALLDDGILGTDPRQHVCFPCPAGLRRRSDCDWRHSRLETVYGQADGQLACFCPRQERTTTQTIARHAVRRGSTRPRRHSSLAQGLDARLGSRCRLGHHFSRRVRPLLPNVDISGADSFLRPQRLLLVHARTASDAHPRLFLHARLYPHHPDDLLFRFFPMVALLLDHADGRDRRPSHYRRAMVRCERNEGRLYGRFADADGHEENRSDPENARHEQQYAKSGRYFAAAERKTIRTGADERISRLQGNIVHHEACNILNGKEPHLLLQKYITSSSPGRHQFHHCRHKGRGQPRASSRIVRQQCFLA